MLLLKNPSDPRPPIGIRDGEGPNEKTAGVTPHERSIRARGKRGEDRERQRKECKDQSALRLADRDMTDAG